jgi:hypothetical protein
VLYVIETFETYVANSLQTWEKHGPAYMHEREVGKSICTYILCKGPQQEFNERVLIF